MSNSGTQKIIYVIGSFIYWRDYINKSSKRGLVYMISMAHTLALIALAIMDVVLSSIDIRA